VVSCKFSNKYRGQYGLITLQDNDTKLKKPYKKLQQYTWISLDIDPIKSGVHCFRIKVRGRNGFMYMGLHRDIKNASDSYEDTQSCGAEIFSWYKSDTEKEVKYDKTFEKCRDKRKLSWDMMITLNNNEQTLKFRQNIGDIDKEMTVPILSGDAEWIPYFILFAGGYHQQKYNDTSMKIYKIDPKLFGKNDNFKE